MINDTKVYHDYPVNAAKATYLTRLTIEFNASFPICIEDSTDYAVLSTSRELRHTQRGADESGWPLITKRAIALGVPTLSAAGRGSRRSGVNAPGRFSMRALAGSIDS